MTTSANAARRESSGGPLQKKAMPAIIEADGKRYLAILDGDCHAGARTILGRIDDREGRLPLKKGERIYRVEEGLVARGRSGFVAYVPISGEEKDAVKMLVSQCNAMIDPAFLDAALIDTLPVESHYGIWTSMQRN